MKVNRFIIVSFVLILAINLTSSADENDKFDAIKKKIAEAALIKIDFLIEVESKIFEDTDSLYGSLAIASDGRYNAEINNDIYLYDGKVLWEYSAENNQATKKTLKDDEYFENRLIFLKELDRHFKSKVIIPDSTYQLFRMERADKALPDSMYLFIDGEAEAIALIEYFDLNEDLNLVHIENQVLSDSIDPDMFHINLPDSAEIISLP
jgi:outer membrane lipoprotein-sorting protein